MSLPAPEVGLVVRYDFLWREEWEQGREHGRKDRPCAVVLLAEPADDGRRQVVVAPVTHRAPEPPGLGVAIPPRVARQLGLDHERSWVLSNHLNRFPWPEGLTPAAPGRWSFGFLPPRLYDRLRERILQQARARTRQQVDRRSDPEQG